MKFADLGRKIQNFTTENSPAILTAIGVTGAVTAAYLTGTATVKAVRILDDEENAPSGYIKDEHRAPLTSAERFKLVWKLYIPAAGVLTLTCISIILANRIGTRRTAVAASALALSERAIDEYKNKVVEIVGKNKEKTIRDEIAKDQVERDYQPSEFVVQTDGKVLCHDAYSGRFFQSTVLDIERAVNSINREIQSHDSATISDFYDLIGLTHTAISDDMGWNNAEPLNLAWSTCTTPDKKYAAHSFDFESRPILRPWSAVSFR